MTLPLDTTAALIKNSSYQIASMPPTCDHKRTTMIARRDGVDYVECLDCRQIFEAEDLEPVAVDEDED